MSTIVPSLYVWHGKAQAQHLCHNQKITDARELKEASARFVTLKASTSPKSKVTKVVV